MDNEHDIQVYAHILQTVGNNRYSQNLSALSTCYQHSWPKYNLFLLSMFYLKLFILQIKH